MFSKSQKSFNRAQSELLNPFIFQARILQNTHYSCHGQKQNSRNNTYNLLQKYRIAITNMKTLHFEIKVALLGNVSAGKVSQFT
jgi:hypothetical protein